MAESREDKFVKQLNFSSGNLAQEWRTFKARFAVYRVAKKFADMDEEVQIANLLVLMGSDSVNIYEHFVFNAAVAAERKTLDNVIKMFDGHFEPVKNVIYERLRFNSMKQGDLPIHQFITQLRTQAANCDYGDVKDDLIRDRIVVGVTDDRLRDYLIDIDDLNLQKCITKAKQYISHHEQTAKFTSGDNVDMMRSYHRGSRSAAAPPPVGYRKGDMGSSMSASDTRKCFLCNKPWHKKDVCPARRSLCKVCHQKGHWAAAAACKLNKNGSAKAHEITEGKEELTQELDGLFLCSDSE